MLGVLSPTEIKDNKDSDDDSTMKNAPTAGKTNETEGQQKEKSLTAASGATTVTEDS